MRDRLTPHLRRAASRAWVLLRHVFPASGEPYSLFNRAIFVMVWGLVGYALTTPPEATREALRAPLILLSDVQLGWAMTAITGLAVAAAYLAPTWDRMDEAWALLAALTGALCLYALLGLVTGGPVRAGTLNTLLWGYVFRDVWLDWRQPRPRPLPAACGAGA